MDFLQAHLLSAIVFMPLVGAVILLALPSRWRGEIRLASFAVSLLTLAMCLMAFQRVKGTGDFEIVELAPWIPAFAIQYHLGADGVSVLLLMLTAVLIPVAILASWREIDRRVKGFHVLLLVAESGMLGTFVALDMFLFFVFWEAVFVPMAFLVGIWGGGHRVRAATAFLLFMLAGAAVLLVTILAVASRVGSFDLLAWYAHRFALPEQLWLFAGFALAFAIAVPIIGLHTWFPDAQAEAPTAGSILLAGVLLKMGAYGFFRFAMPLFPLAVAASIPTLLVFAVAGIIGGAMLALVQPDLKRLIAYFSLSQMGCILLGLAALDPQAAAGAFLQMASHGLAIGALCLLVGMLSARRQTSSIADYGGTARSLPVLSCFFILMALSSVGVPGLGGFAGEVLVLLGAFQTRTTFGAIAIVGTVLMAGAMLLALVRVFFGPLMHEEERRLPDVTAREGLALVPVVALIVLIGVWPQGVLAKLWRSADAFVKLTQRVEMIVPATAPAAPSSDQQQEGERQGNSLRQRAENE